MPERPTVLVRKLLERVSLAEILKEDPSENVPDPLRAIDIHEFLRNDDLAQKLLDRKESLRSFLRREDPDKVCISFHTYSRARCGDPLTRSPLHIPAR